MPENSIIPMFWLITRSLSMIFSTAHCVKTANWSSQPLMTTEAIPSSSSPPESGLVPGVTAWNSIYLCGIFAIIQSSQFSIFFSSLWPYLKTVSQSNGNPITREKTSGFIAYSIHWTTIFFGISIATAISITIFTEPSSYNRFENSNCLKAPLFQKII